MQWRDVRIHDHDGRVARSDFSGWLQQQEINQNLHDKIRVPDTGWGMLKTQLIYQVMAWPVVFGDDVSASKLGYYKNS